MGIAASQFKDLLSNIFKAGNSLILLSSIVGETGTTLGPEYEIKKDDFTVSDNGVVTSTNNMLLYLCETDGGDGTAVGFGVLKSGALVYTGRFSAPMSIGYNTVPTIKKYNDQIEPKEGVKITLTVTEV